MLIQVLKGGPLVDVVDNAFCPTGKGGGVDPTCSSSDKGPVGSANRSLTEDEVDFVEKNAFYMGTIKSEYLKKNRESEGYRREIKHFESLIPALGKEQAVESYKRASKYTATVYGSMNKRLRSGKTPTGVKEMDDFVRHGNKSEVDLLHRGVSKGEYWNDLQKRSIGDVFEDEAFVSTSESYDAAHHFSRRRGKGGVIQIVGVKGKGTYAPRSLMDSSKGEEEVLLPRGSRFRIVEKNKDVIKVELIK